jgi:UDP-N-acetylmuramate--alanine ligase
MNLKDIKKVHCIGIGGIGVSALAKYFLARGAKVSGSNISDNGLDSLRLLGMDIAVGHDESNVPEGAELVIYSSAVAKDNSELLHAKEKGIKTLSYTAALGEIMKEYTGVAVSGTNGKTTTTALLGTIISHAQMEPTIILGGNVREWDGNFKTGNGDVFLVEGCEYKKNMLNLNPKMIVLTNIEEDHLDCYKNIEDIRDTFAQYVERLKEEDVLVFNADDDNIMKCCMGTHANKISYGLSSEYDLYAKNIKVTDGRQEFDVVYRSENIGKFKTALPGEFNVYNILAAVAAALHLGVNKQVILNAIENFGGIERRFEIFNDKDGKIVVSDYAHHPTSVRETISSAKQMYKGKKILAVFQPHQRDRTIKLFDEFAEAFDEAEKLILVEIYDVAGRESGQKVSSQDLVEAIKKRKPNLQISFAKDIIEAEKLIQEKKHDFDVVLVMGAGDVYKVVDSLV